MRRLFIHAPNVHVGGGGVLLKALLETPNLGEFAANLDARAASMFQSASKEHCVFGLPTIQGRVRAEWRLFRDTRPNDLVFCFHGLPPMLPVKGEVVVFKQNRLHLDSDSLSRFSWKTRLRLSMERLICKMFRNRVHEYIVQTPSMRLAVETWHGGAPLVRIIPFLVQSQQQTESDPLDLRADCEFIYVADGESHKNHGALISAWILLASEGIYPSLALTLPARNQALWKEIEISVKKYNLRVVNLGALNHQEILARYRSARALIFPSTTESFGLPLLEATSAGLPIIAGELDFVRDVCVPQETFDPASPRSIAAAVKRFMNIASSSLRIRTPEEFIAELKS